MKLNHLFLSLLATLAGTLFAGCSNAPKAVDHSIDYSFTTEEYFCQREGLNIYGKLYLPEGENQKWPLVIYSHGIGSSHSAGEPYAEALAQKGYAAYCFDFCGSSPRSKSDGNTDEMTIFTEKKDLTAIIANLKNNPSIDPDRVYLLGISLGGLVSSLTAAEMPEQIRNLLLVYPALCAPDDARKTYDQDGNLLDPDKPHMGGDNYNKAMLQFDPFEVIGAYEKPVLLIHGTEDRLVPIAYSERAAEVYKNADLIKIEGAGHGFRGEPLEKAISLVIDQLAEWE